MGQIVYDAVFTVINIGILVAITLLCVKLYHYVNEKKNKIEE